MNIIDHRILIPASQDKVWEHLSDITRNPKWQTDCKEVSVLTTMRAGSGTRWRVTTRGGRDQVCEITAWYDRLGYEYRIVDGSNFKANKGLLRLQEVPEGTIVQWTFSYELNGMFSGLQNTLGARRRIESEIVDSLRGLYRFVGKSLDNQLHQPKSLMREAPDVEARAHYKPRHPSVLDEKAATKLSLAPQPVNLMTEPVAEPDDTRPNPVGAPATAVNMPVTPQSADGDAAFKPPTAPPTTQRPMETVPTGMSAPDTPKSVATPVISQAAVTWDTVPELPRLPVTDPTEIDTGKVSVFEVFGLTKPSETQEMRAVPVADTPTLIVPTAISTAQSTVVALTVASEHRVGLRLKLRRQSVAIRKP
ncbi:MAG: SRPBCC family protein [Armatimonadetes bacterium]|nr:SRPBCC family protein [Anaerolineae bacterium]